MARPAGCCKGLTSSKQRAHRGRGSLASYEDDDEDEEDEQDDEEDLEEETEDESEERESEGVEDRETGMLDREKKPPNKPSRSKPGH